MKLQLLELHLSQLLSSWSKSKLNIYSDLNKESYHKGLKTLVKSLTSEDFNSLSCPDMEVRKRVIDFVFKSLEFLNNSTQNDFPLEIVECLNVALKDWCDNDEFIIVTSLANNLSSFSFDPSLAFDDPLMLLIKTTYNVEFKKRLIQINLPQSLSKDYLANVVLYHELGHFIDIKYKISNALASHIIFCINNNSFSPIELNTLEFFFPFLKDATLSLNEKGNWVLRHLSEYFSDIFASQYVGKCSNYYLDYITNSNSNHSLTHPSTLNRINLVDDFIDGKANFINDLLFLATSTIPSSKSLIIRYQKINSTDILKLIPIEISNENQLSYLYIIGWDIWQNYNQEFEKKNNVSVKFKPSKRYQIINNLIEKSISNFIIKECWGKAKAKCI